MVIPVITTFDNNYVLPASVAFSSFLHCMHLSHPSDIPHNSECLIQFIVLHNGISQNSQDKLRQTLAPFSLAPFNLSFSLKFIDLNDRFLNEWELITSKHHFKKEVFYKLLIPNLFKEYDKAIVTDVDVLFCQDVRECFINFDCESSYLLAGVRIIDYERYFGWEGYKKFSESEREALHAGFDAGFYVANLKRMRETKFEEKCLKFMSENISKLQMCELDVLNICLDNAKTNSIYPLPLKHMVCFYYHDLYGKELENLKPHVYSAKEIKEAALKPSMIHYSSNEKPWLSFEPKKFALYYNALAGLFKHPSPFLVDFLQHLCLRLKSNDELANRNLDLENRNLDLENRNLDLENRNLDLENRNLDLENRNLDLENRNLDLENRNLDLENRLIRLDNLGRLEKLFVKIYRRCKRYAKALFRK
ncbi:glycosyltransferase family 8 protein [Helicobacter cetorum]|uniref:Glycosyl transferase family protein n=1 Tax=Helicobacter cetorum (strain ATCC BAA-540 / CCUG 52418 / MIT 99-5656) TaxID=1163745 RepID=I0EQJ1_HELCM|nr:glycosyltransferase [Helicobacter cetorum]AFI05210.1 glycosyl transferase family protein [Helicobacter cetorum MIT 99-5656]